jgi:hypothetical protein
MAEILESDIQNAESVLISFINETFPAIETRTGSAFRSLVITPAATMYALFRKELAAFNESLNILDVDLSTVDESVMEAQLNNFIITRKDGSTSSGIIKISVLTDKEYIVPVGTVFLTEDETEFSPTEDLVVPAGSLLSDGETSFFLVNVTSNSVTSTIVAQDTVFTLNSLSFIDNAVSGIAAYADFSQGRAQETIEEFRDRATESITVRDLVTKKSINAVLKEEFAEVLDVVTSGYGDLEMLRDLIRPFNIHKGGDVDIFVRTDRIPATVTIDRIVPAELRIDLSGVEVPILKIGAILKLEDNFSETLEEGVDYVIEYLASPNWPSAQFLDVFLARYSARFSPQELIRINILKPELESKQLRIHVTRPNNIQGIQDFVDHEDNRVLTSSILVRSQCPVFISMHIAYNRKVFDAPPDLAGIRSNILDYINNAAGAERLQVSKIVKIVQEAEGVHDVELPLTVNAEVHKTDGSVETLSFSNELEISESKPIGFSQRICQYIVKEADISFSEIII